MTVTGPEYRRLRQAAGLTSAEVAARAGVTPDTLGRFERGRTVARRSTLSRLVAALDPPMSAGATADAPADRPASPQGALTVAAGPVVGVDAPAAALDPRPPLDVELADWIDQGARLVLRAAGRRILAPGADPGPGWARDLARDLLEVEQLGAQLARLVTTQSNETTQSSTSRYHPQ